MGGARDLPPGHAVHLAQLGHEVGLGMEPARGVDQHDVVAAGHRHAQAVGEDGGGIGPFGPPVERALRALRPDLELLRGRGPERVGRAEQHRAALRSPRGGQLADGGGLARPVHPDHEDHPGPGGEGLDPQRQGQGAPDLLAQDRPHGLEPPARDAAAQGKEHLHGLLHRGKAHVGGEQRFLDRLQGAGVERPTPAHEILHRHVEDVPGAAQPRPQPVEDPRLHRPGAHRGQSSLSRSSWVVAECRTAWASPASGDKEITR